MLSLLIYTYGLRYTWHLVCIAGIERDVWYAPVNWVCFIKKIYITLFTLTTTSVSYFFLICLVHSFFLIDCFWFRFLSVSFLRNFKISGQFHGQMFSKSLIKIPKGTNIWLYSHHQGHNRYMETQQEWNIQASRFFLLFIQLLKW